MKWSTFYRSGFSSDPLFLHVNVEFVQTFGFIFGLSDAIIGLTIFAVGNSLADLVANMSVAVSLLSMVIITAPKYHPTGICADHGILCMLWWPHAQHSSRSRHLGLIYNPPDLEAIQFTFHVDAHSQHDRITRIVAGNYDRGPTQRLLPDSKLGNIPHNVICYHYGCQYICGSPWLASHLLSCAIYLFSYPFDINNCHCLIYHRCACTNVSSPHKAI